MRITALLLSKSRPIEKDHLFRLPISWAFMLFLLASTILLGFSLGSVMLLKVSSLIKENREELIHQKMLSISSQFYDYMHLRDIVLKDYAKFPVLLQGVMQPTSSLANAQDFIDELVILGDKAPLHLFNINEELIYSTQESSPCLPQTLEYLRSQVKARLIPMQFCSAEDDSYHSWLLATPIHYHGHVEGYLLAELANKHVFANLSLEEVIQHNQIQWYEKDRLLVTLGPELTDLVTQINISNTSISFRYRTDKQALLTARKTVVTNLLLSLSVVLIVILALSQKLGYIYFIQPFEHLRRMTLKLAEGESFQQADNKVRIQEIFDLQKQFKHMAEKIEHREQDLRRASNEQSQLNQQILQQQQMLVHSEKLASVGQLAAGVAHEINNPTGFVKGNLEILTQYSTAINEVLRTYELLAREFTSNDYELSQFAKEHLQVLEQLKTKHDINYIIEDLIDLTKESLEGVVRIQNIVKDLKSFSRVDDHTLKAVDINDEVIEVALRLVSSEIKYKCTVHKNLSALPALECMPGEISQVMMNLLINACDAIDEHGDIAITSYFDDGDIFIDISDTGMGIPEESKLKLFDPFYTTKDIGKGTGLGLAICQAIINKHGGDITFDSELGKGTTFSVRLPANKN